MNFRTIDLARLGAAFAVAALFSATACAEEPLPDPRLTEVWEPEPAIVTSRFF